MYFRTDGNPPMLCISSGPRQDSDLGVKDTLSNLEETGEFVINIVSLPLSNTMYESSKSHPPEADEFEKAGLTPAPCEVVGALRVAEAGVSVECVLDRVLVLGRMVRFHVRDELYENGRMDVARLRPPRRQVHEGRDDLRPAHRRRLLTSAPSRMILSTAG